MASVPGTVGAFGAARGVEVPAHGGAHLEHGGGVLRDAGGVLVDVVKDELELVGGGHVQLQDGLKVHRHGDVLLVDELGGKGQAGEHADRGQGEQNPFHDGVRVGVRKV
jgi:hypothetical protein